MDYFTLMKQKMIEQYGPSALNHPHSGIIGRGLTPAQTLASINPEFQNPQQFAHIIRDYSTPITIEEEPLTQNMDVDA